jgi:transposase
MEVNGTKKAFKELINQRAISNVLGVGRGTVSVWKKRIEEDNVYPSEKTMVKFLKKAGAKIIKEVVIWKLKDAA